MRISHARSRFDCLFSMRPSCKDLVPVTHLGEHDFWPEQFVQKSPDELDAASAPIFDASDIAAALGGGGGGGAGGGGGGGIGAALGGGGGGRANYMLHATSCNAIG